MYKCMAVTYDDGHSQRSSQCEHCSSSFLEQSLQLLRLIPESNIEVSDKTNTHKDIVRKKGNA